jgi:GntR family transcriptional regulator / MocR family aminotransferase
VFDYAPNSLGHRPLREAIVNYLARTRAVQCDVDQVIIVSDPLQAIDLITRVLIDRGDQIALENPSFLDIRRIFLAYGAELCPIPVDDFGMQVKNLFNLRNNRIKLAYVTPSHQFPLGVTLSLPRRLELLAWAKASNTIIIEEDYDSEFRYSGHPIPSLQGLDPTAPVIYVGSFLEALFPALRLGYLVVPPSLIHVLARAKWLAARQSSMLEQYVLTDFILEGHLERHIRQMRMLYSKRRQTLEKALIKAFNQRITFLGEAAGTHVTVRLESHLSDSELLKRAAREGVGLMSTKSFYLENYPSCEYLLGYTDLSECDIQTGVDLLSRVITQSTNQNIKACR